MLSDTLTEQYEQQSGIKREGDRIVIPAHMSYRDASDAILSHEAKMEEEAQTYVEFDAHPNDALVALVQSIRESFGQLLGSEIDMGFFGKMPCKSVAIPINAKETMNVPIGYSEIPGIPVKLNIVPNYNESHPLGGSLSVVFSYLRKYETLVKAIEKNAKQWLVDHPLFKGKAIDSRFNFLDLSTFDRSRVVYGKNERRQIEANILYPIQHTSDWLHYGNSLKRGVLLTGSYGTGKTLTARLIASECEKNNWTFISVRPGDSIVTALNFANRYAPAVVFFEDIDQETGSERTDLVNTVLNTMDGILSKDSKVMVIMTTNHPDKIQKGMLRTGRIDSMIEMGKLDAASMTELVRVCARDLEGNSMIDGDLDEEAIFEAGKDYVPAFVVEAATKAKAYAHSRNGSNGRLKISTEDVVEAMLELRPQWEMMTGGDERQPENVDTSLRKLVTKEVNENIKAIKGQIEEIHSYHFG